MQHYKKLLPCFFAFAVSGNAFALSIPSIGSSSSYDEFKTTSGMVCRQATDGGTKLQIGALAGKDNSTNNYYYDDRLGNQGRDNQEAGVFIQLIVPIGAPDRIECRTLYDIEVEKQLLELQQLKAQVELLKKRAELAGLKDLPEL